MTILDRLFSLDRLSLADPSAMLEFARPLPAWAWLLAAIAAAAIAALGYSKLAGPRGARIALGVSRTLLLLLVLAVISGPQLTKPNERVELDWIVYLYDRSASMTLEDAQSAGKRVSREQQLADALANAGPTLDRLEQGRELLHLGFDSATFDTSRASLPPAEGEGTRLGRAIGQALDRVRAKPVAGMVVFSDGRSADTPDRATLRRLERQRIPVVVVPLGSASAVRDSAIRRATAPRFAFVDDTIPVVIDLELSASASVELVDGATGVVLDQARVEAPATEDGSRQSITLSSSSSDAGQRDLRIVLRPDGEDLVTENNSAELRVELVDRPLRVLYLEGYPRWEYRYIKNLLVRERSIRSTIMLLSLRRSYIQEGDVPVAGLPDSPEAWAEYDVVILGDLRPELLGSERAAQLRDLVAQRGAGLIWIGGEGATPSAWRDTDLEALLPIALGSGDSGAITRYDQPVVMQRTPAADRLGLLALGEGAGDAWPQRLADHDTGWSRLFAAQRIDPGAVKPTASVLAEALPLSGEPTPLMLSMRYGAGRVLYVGTDETWRWRYALGDALMERFWIPLARVLGREGLARGQGGLRLEATPTRATVGESVVFTLDVTDAAAAESAPPSVTVTVDAPGDDTGTQVKLFQESDRDGPPVYRGTWVAERSGDFEVNLDPASLAALASTDAPPTTSVLVSRPDDELRFGQSDHEALRVLAEQTGGAVISPTRLDSLSDHIPNRSRRIATAPDVETIWDTPAVLIAFIVLVLFEWIGRRLIRLV